MHIKNDSQLWPDDEVDRMCLWAQCSKNDVVSHLVSWPDVHILNLPKRRHQENLR